MMSKKDRSGEITERLGKALADKRRAKARKVVRVTLSGLLLIVAIMVTINSFLNPE